MFRRTYGGRCPETAGSVSDALSLVFRPPLTFIRQVAELHLDERIQSSREAIGKHLATGQKKVSTAFNSLWNDIETMREAQRQRAAETKVKQLSQEANGAEPASKCLCRADLGKGLIF
jgi:hypothetical protein